MGTGGKVLALVWQRVVVPVKSTSNDAMFPFYKGGARGQSDRYDGVEWALDMVRAGGGWCHCTSV